MSDVETDADESYFGEKRKNKKGKSVSGKIAVLELLKRNFKVYTVNPASIVERRQV